MFEWDEGKDRKLRAERGISFEEIVTAISSGRLLIETGNPKHPGQSLFIVRIGKEIWAVAAEQRGTAVRLVTAYPSRKWRKKYG